MNAGWQGWTGGLLKLASGTVLGGACAGQPAPAKWEEGSGVFWPGMGVPEGGALLRVLRWDQNLPFFWEFMGRFGVGGVFWDGGVCRNLLKWTCVLPFALLDCDRKA